MLSCRTLFSENSPCRTKIEQKPRTDRTTRVHAHVARPQPDPVAGPAEPGKSRFDFFLDPKLPIQLMRVHHEPNYWCFPPFGSLTACAGCGLSTPRSHVSASSTSAGQRRKTPEHELCATREGHTAVLGFPHDSSNTDRHPNTKRVFDPTHHRTRERRLTGILVSW